MFISSHKYYRASTSWSLSSLLLSSYCCCCCFFAVTWPLSDARFPPIAIFLHSISFNSSFDSAAAANDDGFFEFPDKECLCFFTYQTGKTTNKQRRKKCIFPNLNRIYEQQTNQILINNDTLLWCITNPIWATRQQQLSEREKKRKAQRSNKTIINKRTAVQRAIAQLIRAWDDFLCLGVSFYSELWVLLFSHTVLFDKYNKINENQWYYVRFTVHS